MGQGNGKVQQEQEKHMKEVTGAIKNMDMVPIPGLMEINTMEILRTIYEMDKAK